MSIALSPTIPAGSITAASIADGTITYAKLNADASSGRELGYAEITTSATSTSNAPTYTDVVGLTATVTVTSRPISVVFDCSSTNNTVTGGVAVAIREGSTLLSYAFHTVGAGIGNPIHREVRLTPAAGSHTYKISLARVTAAGTSAIFAAADAPAFIQVLER